jgi:hypothetical protein
MQNPEFRFLIARENHGVEMHPWLKHVINGCIFIFNFIVIYNTLKCICLPLIKYLAVEFWKSLTPGNQWLELVAIVCLLIIGSMIYLILSELTYKIETTIEKLHKENEKLRNEIKEKDKLIYELNKDKEQTIIEQQVSEFNIRCK